MASLKDRIRALINRRKQPQAQMKAKKEAEQALKRDGLPDVAQQPIPQATEVLLIENAAEKPAPQQMQQQLLPSQEEQVNARNRATVQPATTTGSLRIALENQSNSNEVYAYITGLAIDNNNAPCLMQADAKTPYYPPSPPSAGAKIPVDVSILLGAPGTTVTATIPRIAGGRIWFSQGARLTFFVDPGPALVEPSIFNASDVNHFINFGFCEFTFNSSQVFANISYVDFVSGIPIALTVESTSGDSRHVSGMPANGLATVCSGLRAQTSKDGRRWSSLIVQNNGQDLRALSPNSGITLNPTWFQTYWTDYVNQVWDKYKSSKLTIQTQAQWGSVSGQVNGSSQLDFGNGSVFGKPTSADIFSNNTGPLGTGGNSQTNTIIPRLAAAFNRSTLLLSDNTPNGTKPSQYYQAATTNHYARIVHAANLDGVGYAFAYDDVTPDGGVGQEGAVWSFEPTLLAVTVGGNKAYSTANK